MRKFLKIRLLEEKDIPLIVVAFDEVNWDKSTQLFQQYLEQQRKNDRMIWVAFMENAIAGYVTLVWKSEYQHFKEKNIPEIKDLNVLPHYRHQGIATLLMEHAEQAAKRQGTLVGLGVGLYAGYGAAQRLYNKRCYIPDGMGITYNYTPVIPGENYSVDDDLILWLTKILANN